MLALKYDRSPDAVASETWTLSIPSSGELRLVSRVESASFVLSWPSLRLSSLDRMSRLVQRSSGKTFVSSPGSSPALVSWVEGRKRFEDGACEVLELIVGTTSLSLTASGGTDAFSVAATLWDGPCLAELLESTAPGALHHLLPRFRAARSPEDLFS